MKAERINRILSLAGMTSRRKADEWILAGRVTMNGRPMREPGTKAVWGKDSIMIDGEEIPKPSPRIYLMLNKPFGYICSLKDPEGRPVVTDLMKAVDARLYPVGRLDFDSIGLLLLTNDGEWAHHLTHPRYHVPKTYKVTLKGMISEGALGLLKEGLNLEDGFSGRSKTTLLNRSPERSVIRMTITSGRSRLVRRMVEAAGYEVIQLVRTGFGTLELGELKIGDFRYLETHEVESMKKTGGIEEKKGRKGKLKG
jgi:23S rRNA pseudouridine2605 synthase